MGWAGPAACLPGHGVPQLTGHVERCLMECFFSLCAVQTTARATSSLLIVSRDAGVWLESIVQTSSGVRH